MFIFRTIGASFAKMAAKKNAAVGKISQGRASNIACAVEKNMNNRIESGVWQTNSDNLREIIPGSFKQRCPMAEHVCTGCGACLKGDKQTREGNINGEGEYVQEARTVVNSIEPIANKFEPESRLVAPQIQPNNLDMAENDARILIDPNQLKKSIQMARKYGEESFAQKDRYARGDVAEKESDDDRKSKTDEEIKIEKPYAEQNDRKSKTDEEIKIEKPYAEQNYAPENKSHGIIDTKDTKVRVKPAKAKKDYVVGTYTRDEIMASQWLRKLYGHLIGLPCEEEETPKISSTKPGKKKSIEKKDVNRGENKTKQINSEEKKYESRINPVVGDKKKNENRYAIPKTAELKMQGIKKQVYNLKKPVYRNIQQNVISKSITRIAEKTLDATKIFIQDVKKGKMFGQFLRANVKLKEQINFNYKQILLKVKKIEKPLNNLFNERKNRIVRKKQTISLKMGRIFERLFGKKRLFYKKIKKEI